MKTRNVSIAVGLAALAKLDLSQVKRKLMEAAPEGRGWDQETADNAENWYRRFLEVCLRFPQFPAVPNRAIDDFWHQHILDTQAYAKDCEEIFGHFIHHYPYFGMNGDRSERDDSFTQTNRIYQTLFGESLVTVGADCNMSACKADDPRAPQIPTEPQASQCNHGGSGTGCGQGGGKGKKFARPNQAMSKAADCNKGACCAQAGASECRASYLSEARHMMNEEARIFV